MLRKLRQRESGQALIELALVLPLVLVFVLVLVDFGIALDRREVLQHAVREGARRAAVGADVSEVQTYAANQAEGVVEPADVSVCYDDFDGNGEFGNVGDNVRVSANFVYQFNVGGEILSAWGTAPVPTITMTPSANMRLEKTVAGGAAC